MPPASPNERRDGPPLCTGVHIYGVDVAAAVSTDAGPGVADVVKVVIHLYDVVNETAWLVVDNMIEAVVRRAI